MSIDGDRRVLPRPDRSPVVQYSPGLTLAVGVAVLAEAVADAVGLSPLVVGLAIGVAVGNVNPRAGRVAPGLRFAARRCLQAGVVLLGLRLAAGDLVALGPVGVAAVVATVGLTFIATRWMARGLGLGDGLGLLVATGFSICGVSAIAAMEAATRSDEEDVATAALLVTVCGSLAITTLPTLGTLFGMSAVDYGTWAGASVHDVAQVLAAASSFGPQAVERAVVVKLTRVVLLAPIVTMMAARLSPVGQREGDGTERTRRMTVPTFVLGFIGCMALRSTGLLPTSALAIARNLEGFLITMGMVGVGAAVRLARFRTVGARPFLLGALSWTLIAAAGFGVAAIT